MPLEANEHDNRLTEYTYEIWQNLLGNFPLSKKKKKNFSIALKKLDVPSVFYYIDDEDNEILLYNFNETSTFTEYISSPDFLESIFKRNFGINTQVYITKNMDTDIEVILINVPNYRYGIRLANTDDYPFEEITQQI